MDRVIVPIRNHGCSDGFAHDAEKLPRKWPGIGKTTYARLGRESLCWLTDGISGSVRPVPEAHDRTHAQADS